MGRLSFEEVIRRSKKNHNNKFKYLSIEQLNDKRKSYAIKFECLECKSIILQAYQNHFKGARCNNCYKNSIRTFEKYKQKCIEKYGDKYEYIEYIKDPKNSKIKYQCKKCNYINLQRCNLHLKGVECHNCSYKNKSKNMTKSLNFYLKKAKKIHPELYNYSHIDKTNYKNGKTKVKILCNQCNRIFEQNMYKHISGCGCPICKFSKGEKIIMKYLIENNIDFISQYKFNNQKDIIGEKRFDFYIPKRNLVIEYHGIQHFMFNDFYHKNIFDFLDQVKRDYDKQKFCKNNKINFIEIHYNHKIINKLNKIFKINQNLV